MIDPGYEIEEDKQQAIQELSKLESVNWPETARSKLISEIRPALSVKVALNEFQRSAGEQRTKNQERAPGARTPNEELRTDFPPFTFSLSLPPKCQRARTDPNGTNLSRFWEFFRHRLFDGARPPFRVVAWSKGGNSLGGVF